MSRLVDCLTFGFGFVCGLLGILAVIHGAWLALPFVAAALVLWTVGATALLEREER